MSDEESCADSHSEDSYLPSCYDEFECDYATEDDASDLDDEEWCDEEDEEEEEDDTDLSPEQEEALRKLEEGEIDELPDWFFYAPGFEEEGDEGDWEGDWGTGDDLWYRDQDQLPEEGGEPTIVTHPETTQLTQVLTAPIDFDALPEVSLSFAVNSRGMNSV